MKPLHKKPSRKGWRVSYLAFYLLLLVVFFQFHRGQDQNAFCILFLLSSGAVLDLCFTRDHLIACLNWLVFFLLAGCILLWKFLSIQQWVLAGVCGFAVVALLAALVVKWRQFLK